MPHDLDRAIAEALTALGLDEDFGVGELCVLSGRCRKDHDLRRAGKTIPYPS